MNYFSNIEAAGVKQKRKRLAMPPQTRARGKQQDVSKVEVDRGTPAAQEKRQSSCLHKLSLSGASNNPDPNSGIHLHNDCY